MEFSGPLLSQSNRIDELLERHERQIRRAVRKSWFHRGTITVTSYTSLKAMLVLKLFVFFPFFSSKHYCRKLITMHGSDMPCQGLTRKNAVERGKVLIHYKPTKVLPLLKYPHLIFSYPNKSRAIGQNFLCVFFNLF